MRKHADWVVDDAPAYARSKACLAVAGEMDANVLVVAADRPDTSAPAAPRDALSEAGGRCAGIVFNQARIAPAPFLRAGRT